MSLEKYFCPSPWFHMRITNRGDMIYCRWSDDKQNTHNLADYTPQQFFQDEMQPIRQQMLAGDRLSSCVACYQKENHGKVSGREKQLLKIGVVPGHFAKSLASSPWRPIFADSNFVQMPQDWQVDLGNFCNSACVFCTPEFSSRLANEHLQLGLIQKLPPSNWTDRPDLVDKFVTALKASDRIRYIHFIGGETTITPAFLTILKVLVENNLNKTITIGFTTNLSVFPQAVVDMLAQFQGVNLGMSVESFTPINDYVRYPVRLDTVKLNLSRWIQIGRKLNWLLQLRITPTVLTLPDLITVYDFAWEHGIAIESCNFVQNPEFLKPSLTPWDIRKTIIDNITKWLEPRQANHDKIVNIRDPNVVHQQICQDLASYKNYLENEPEQLDLWPKLVVYLKQLESIRKNSILTYLPQYEKLFRTAGY